MIAVQNYDSRADWLEARRSGIGSSDAAANWFGGDVPASLLFVGNGWRRT